MKKLLPLFVLLFCLQLSAQKFDNALSYLEFISDEQTTISKTMWRYTQAIAQSKNDKSIESRHNALIKSMDKAIARISTAESFGDSGFKEKVIANLTLNKKLLNHEYAEVLDMKKIAEESYDDMEAYFMAREMANQKMEEAQNEFEIDYYKYAADNNIDIIESETDLSKKIKLSNLVFDHYNEMYLLFFKAQINEIYLNRAIDAQDVNAIQQNADALISAANEGLNKLSSINLYENDASIVKSTEKAFQFFIEEAQNEIPKIVDFLVLSESFEKINAAIEDTPKRKRTKEQIDVYNKKVKEINKGVDRYNKTLAFLNKNRSDILNNLNATNEKFLAKHIPKD